MIDQFCCWIFYPSLLIKLLINFHQYNDYFFSFINFIYFSSFLFQFLLIALPVFDTKPQDVKVGINGVAKFECVASGNPQPSVYWTKEGSKELMFPDNTYGRHHITLEGVLEIKGVRKEDGGYYVCSAFSVAGSGTTRAFLEVSTRPNW